MLLLLNFHLLKWVFLSCLLFIFLNSSLGHSFNTGRPVTEIASIASEHNQTVPERREYPGVLYPLHDIPLSLGVSGPVASVVVKLGDKVKKGQLLLKVDDTAEEIEARRRLAVLNNRAELQSLSERIARSKVLRDDIRQLYEQSGSVSRDEVFRIELEYFSLTGRYEQLEADKIRESLEYKAAEHQRNMRRLMAPSSGTVIELDVEEGEWVTPGRVLLRLVDISSGILRLAIPEAVAQQLKKGDFVPLRFEAYPELPSIEGEVTFVSVVADPASGRVHVQITFDNRSIGIRPGSKGFAVLPNIKSL
jgi:RND family efflux transporter MFP subunit